MASAIPLRHQLTSDWKSPQTVHQENFQAIQIMPTDVQFIQVKVKPNARTSRLEQLEDGTWLAQLKSPPIDGKANQELIELVAGHFECRKSAISIKSGAAGRLK